MTTTDPATGWIRCIEPEDIPTDLAELALETAAAAAAALRLPPVTVFLYLPATEDDPDAVRVRLGQEHSRVGGFTYLGEKSRSIFVRGDLEPELTAEVTAHECRHIFQAVNGWKALYSLDELETDARRFHTAWMEKNR